MVWPPRFSTIVAILKYAVDLFPYLVVVVSTMSKAVSCKLRCVHERGLDEESWGVMF